MKFWLQIILVATLLVAGTTSFSEEPSKMPGNPDRSLDDQKTEACADDCNRHATSMPMAYTAQEDKSVKVLTREEKGVERKAKGDKATK